MLKWFVAEYGNIYGNYNVIYNVHSLIHLPKDVKNFGPLESFSAFKYESYLGKLKSKIRASSRPLHQISNRIIEQNLTDEKKAFVIPSYPIIKYDNKKDEVKYLEFFTFTISKNKPDNCCILKNGCNIIIYDIYTIDKDINVEKTKIELKVQQFLSPQSFFHEPCNSQILGISVVNTNDLSDYFVINETDISTKCLLFPLENNTGKHVVIPIIHTHE